MGKISLVSIKYNIHAKFETDGMVEKPDVIGAVFGQTEGLLGEDLELRELQKNGKIGRIEVNLETVDSKTKGEIIVPTSLDKTETTLIAAALETIERIGPCNAKVNIDKVEDIRGSKREFLLERAKKLLEDLSSNAPDSREMQTEVTSSVRTARVVEYGEEKLPAGPDMENSEVIVVEGRADVINLLRYGIKNVIGMNGTSLPKEIAELGKVKSLTLFVDGDRGGVLITKNVLMNSKIDYIATAPAGKEVEELAGKEILACLRARVPSSEFLKREEREESKGRRVGSGRGRGRESRDREEGFEEKEEKFEPAATTDEEQKVFSKMVDEISGTRTACLLDEKLNVLRKTSISDLNYAIQSLKRRGFNVYAIVIDGTVTGNILRIAEMNHVSHLAARNFAASSNTKVNLVSV